MTNRLKVWIVGMALVTGPIAYGQQEAGISTVSGKVAKMDIESGVITLDNQERYYLGPESILHLDTQVITSIEISPKDPVTIRYVTAGDGKNTIVSLEDNRPPV